MKTVASFRKLWNKQQQELRRLLLRSDQHDTAIALFLGQHAALHAAQVGQSASWSFEDALFEGITEEQIRRIPRNCEHSVAWAVWHTARIEDVAMNLLVAGGPQIALRDNWLERMGITVQDTGNAMDEAGMARLSATIDIQALRAYRVAVGRATREIVQQLPAEALKQKVDPARLERVMAEGAVVQAARGIVDYWGRRTIAGLLLMPPTRHNLVHLNEAWRLRHRRH